MNQRIRELAEQAGIKITPMVVDGVEYEYEEVEMDGSEDLQKFAELIVKECISVPYAMWDQAELNADVAVKIEHRIRDHFGIEQ